MSVKSAFRLKSIKDIFNQKLLLLSMSLLLGCDNGDGQVPPDAVVEISPQSRSWDISPALDESGNCIFDPDHYQDEIFTIRVLDGDDRPIGDVEVMVSLTLAENTYSSPYFRGGLYEDLDGDFIPDENEYVSDAGDSLLFTRTEKYTGAKTLIVRVNLSCISSLTLSVVAEGASGSARIEVDERS